MEARQVEPVEVGNRFNKLCSVVLPVCLLVGEKLGVMMSHPDLVARHGVCCFIICNMVESIGHGEGGSFAKADANNTGCDALKSHTCDG